MNIPNWMRTKILNTAPSHEVRDLAPSTELELFTNPSLVVWSGESHNTIWGYAGITDTISASERESAREHGMRTNWAFRALHDELHLKTGIGFSPEAEIYLGRLQANEYDGLMADLVYIEVAGQAQHYMQTGQFVKDQMAFTINELRKLGYNV